MIETTEHHGLSGLNSGLAIGVPYTTGMRRYWTASAGGANRCEGGEYDGAPVAEVPRAWQNPGYQRTFPFRPNGKPALLGSCTLRPHPRLNLGNGRDLRARSVCHSMQKSGGLP